MDLVESSRRRDCIVPGMSYGDIEERPAKKRRFFDYDPQTNVLEAPGAPSLLRSSTGTSLSQQNGTSSPQESGATRDAPSDGDFDKALFESVVGESDPHVLKCLQDVSGNSTERAINMYLDGSWKGTVPSRPLPASATPDRKLQEPETVENGEHPAPKRRSVRVADMPRYRYVGAFGVGAWATRSGNAVLKHGDLLKIERTKGKQTKVGRGGKPLPFSRQRADIIVRFTTTSGEEVGRLPKDTAAWVSSLIDQSVCHVDGRCVYSPDRVRINDTIYLQLRAHLLRRSFETGLIKPLADNRTTGVFEERETQEEQQLRLRQVSLVKLFGEIGLHPYSANELTEKHKREGILQAAESADQLESKDAGGKAKSIGNDASTPGSEDETEEGKELEQDQLDALYKKAQSFDFNTPTYEPADTFALSLRKYQKQALHWMISKERAEKIDGREESIHPLWEEYKWPVKDVDDKELPTVEGQDSFFVNPYSGELSLNFPRQDQHCLGGILADEMGLGKTIECLSLIHSNKIDVGSRQVEQPPSSVNDLPRLGKRNAVEWAPATTLVVAPMSLLAQWESEATKASKAGTLKTLVYYGADKAIDLQNLCCEANAAAAPNLIVTSYGVVLSEFNQIAAKGGDRTAHGGLFSLEFFRCILDEAHYIKNRQSKTAKACYELSARHRWVLTGTPIVNRLEDLFSLVRFLRVEPWSNFSYWKTFITVPFESGDFLRALNVVQTVLEPLVIRRTKEMKTPDGEPLVPLPNRTIEVEGIELSKAEQEVYDYIYNKAKRTFNATMEAGTLLKSYTTIFAQILRLRQSCCHPVLTRNKTINAEEEESAAAADAVNGLADDMDLQQLIDKFENEEAEQDANKFGAHVLKQIQDEVDNECPICSEEPMIEPAVTHCWHSACKKCLIDYIEHEIEKGKVPLCFNCREPIKKRDVFEVRRHDDTPFYPIKHGIQLQQRDPSPEKRITLRRVGCEGSAKIATLTAHLKQLRRDEPDAKTVVFSQFTSFLDLVGPALSRERIPFLRFDGGMNQKTRSAVLAEFADPHRLGTVLLLSLRAGGVGLNLTAARRVFMLDPWWSFAVEAQAIDRVHRMGQPSEVKVVRFVVKGSIEERMLKVQDRKKFIASSLGMMSEEEKKIQRIEDIKELLA